MAVYLLNATKVTGNCSEDSFQAPQTSYKPETVVNIVFFLAIAFAATASNVLVICAIHSKPRLLRPTYVFILSLAVADLIVGVVVLPLRVVEVMAFQWTRGLIWCQFSLCLTLFSLSASVLNLLSVTCDRFIAISTPFKYQMIMTHKRVAIVVGTTWFVSAFFSFCPLAGIGAMERGKNDHALCRFADTMKVDYMITFFTFVCVLPTVIMSACYFKVYHLARHHERQIAMLRVNERTRGISQSSKNEILILRESKAAKTIGIVVGVFYVCWIPFIVGVFLTIVKSSYVTHIYILLGGSCIFTNSALNPIIYGCRNHEFREAYKKIVFGIFCTQGGHAIKNSVGAVESLPIRDRVAQNGKTENSPLHINVKEMPLPHALQLK